MSRKTYDDSFRAKAVKAVRERGTKSVGEVAQKVGVRANLLYKWNKDIRAGSRNGIPRLDGKPAAKRGRKAIQDGLEGLLTISESLTRTQTAIMAIKQALDGVVGLTREERRQVLLTIAAYDIIQ